MQKSKNFNIRAIKSKIITLKKEQKNRTGEAQLLLEYIFPALQKSPLKNGDIFVLSSKVLAVTQGQVQKIKTPNQFEKLVHQEADQILGGKQVTLTLKNNIFIPWAGIDRSNTPNGTVVLWPEKPYETAHELCKELKKYYKLKNLGVLIVDSFCIPLRKGVSGIALGYAGFQGILDQRGKKDLFGNTLKVTQENIADSLAAAANLIMGQSREQTPFAVISNAPVKFLRKTVPQNELFMPPEECLFQPLYKTLLKKTSRKNRQKQK